MIGTTLQHYRIVRALGSGGMGEVYAAEDLRLHRTVALKILPAEMALDGERLQRFRREAQAIAALNHPNVVTIYGVEEADGIHFLTMELVEGKTLTDLIPSRGLALTALLAIAVPLADAIRAAHERGIVHRDLKPANIMIGADGRLKVLDFGLAKLKAEPQGNSDTADTATAGDLTSKHHVIGTAAYMSPEQAEGRPVDLRSDIFTLGVVLYEMATGVRPFRGSTPMSVISSIIKDAPAPPIEVNPLLPLELDRIIRRCLAKDPGRRYQTAIDLRNDLEDLHQQVTSGARIPAARQRWGWRAWAAVAVVPALLAAGAYLAWRRAAPQVGPTAPMRAEFRQVTSATGVEWFPSVSPDGKWLVYAADGGGTRHIYLQSVTGQTPLDLTKDSTSDDDQPVFSPDGERIAFRSSRDGGGIFVMGRTGEAVRRVTRVGFRPAWSPDGRRLAFTTENVDLNPWNSQGTSELWTVDVDTGRATQLNAGDAVLASWSPDGERIAFTRRLGPRGQRGGIWSVPVSGGEPTRVTEGEHRDWTPAWSHDGRHLYFCSDRSGSMNLWRVAIDQASGEPQGDPEPVTTPAAFVAHPSISADGKYVAYAAAAVTANVQRVGFDPRTLAVRGEPAWVTTGSRRWSMPDPSPDGQWVAFYSLTQPEGHLYVARPDGSGRRQLTGDKTDRMPRWSPDGQWIAAFSNRSGTLELWKVRPDGSDLQQMTEQGGSYFAWSPDGRRIVTTGLDSAVRTTWLFDTSRPWSAQTPAALPQPKDLGGAFSPTSWSPDGERLAGQVEHTGRGIAIATYSFATQRYERLTDMGEWPQWLPDSRRIIFVANGDSFYVVDASTKAVRKVYSSGRDVIGPPRLSRDATAMYFTRRETESDIWLLTLQ